MSQSGRPLLSNVYNQNAYFSGNRVRTSLVVAVLKAFPIQHTHETQDETLGEGAFYTVRLLVRIDQADKIRWSVQSREIRAKKTADRRGPEQSEVKWHQKTSLWLMCCTLVKWKIVVIAVNIPINWAIKFGVNNYLLLWKPNTQQFWCQEVVMALYMPQYSFSNIYKIK
jgi:sterol desaturase/sphingolipid hydroxylase (fatty acid hydroxylase superfamily)